MSAPQPVRLVEVGPRDGLQNISTIVPLSVKLELIKRLHETGLKTIELTSVVSKRAIPQLADCRELLQDTGIKSLLRDAGMRLPVLVPNLRGLQTAVEHGVREVAVFVSASEGFSRANINCSVQQGLDRAKLVAKEAATRNFAVRGYVSCIFACPYDGPTPHAAVLNCVRQLFDMGCYEVSLGDTVGVGVAADVKALLHFLDRSGVPMSKLAGHFHDTYGQAVSNVQAAYDCGLRVFDSSVAGLGGCPYAPGAKGNVATEDLAYMFQQAGVTTGIDLPQLVTVGVWISQQLSRQNESRAGQALATKAKVDAKATSVTREHDKTSTMRRSLNAPATPSWTLFRDLGHIEIHRSGPNIRITLNRPRNGNTLTTPMISELANFFETAATDKTITRIAITSRGKYFCTGMDLVQAGNSQAKTTKGGSSSSSSSSSSSQSQFESLSRLFEAIDNAPQVTIACLQGPAFGGGVGLAFACDIRLASRAATVTLSEVKLGLCAATISKYLVREWGVSFAREAMLSGRTVSMEELARLGVVPRVVDEPDELPGLLDRYLSELKVAAPRASAMSKELVKLGWRYSGGEEQMAGIRRIFEEMMVGEAESGFGIAEFRRGIKVVDWDAYMARKGMAKL